MKINFRNIGGGGVYSKKKTAFTLIELLVVVLIIGVLAAVALPQYTKAVTKTKIQSLLPILKSLQEAQKIYFMENGEYAWRFEDLHVTMPEGRVLVESEGAYQHYYLTTPSISNSNFMIGIGGGVQFQDRKDCVILQYSQNINKYECLPLGAAISGNTACATKASYCTSLGYSKLDRNDANGNWYIMP